MTEPEKKTRKPRAQKDAKAEVTKPLPVEIEFPSIMDLKQAIQADSNGKLIIAIQFKALVNQYEVFRLINLLKQPHGVLYVKIGSPQSAMDFIFDPKTDKIDILKAASQIVEAKIDEKGDITPRKLKEGDRGPIKIQEATFNHMPDETDPFGVAIDYVENGTGEIRTRGGRGQSPTEAVLAGVLNIGGQFADLTEPFEIRAALEALEPSAAAFKLIRVIDVGSFDLGDVKGDGNKS